ncbi:unnamed protein product [Schistosoma curassoni]|uniref:WH2 domain-containing protein n=1 Tax=Schistosoma curassoni TaxID=6186 RepID=A0A183JPG3_9TREM|nr:unnamed protein product [Schistosoma curassoni]
MEPSRPKEDRKTKEHITTRNGDRHGNNVQKLDRTRKEGPGQSGLENAGPKPMLHYLGNFTKLPPPPPPSSSSSSSSSPPLISK